MMKFKVFFILFFSLTENKPNPFAFNLVIRNKSVGAFDIFVKNAEKDLSLSTVDFQL